VGLHVRRCQPILLVAVSVLVSPVSAQFQQQGSKLVGTGASPGTQFGIASALSGDGKTAVIGDVSGGIWVFTNTNGAWSQQGSRIVGYVQSGNVIICCGGLFGSAVAVSAAGDTLITGGIGTGDGCSAAWIFIRSNGVWSQRGPKLAGSSLRPSRRW
jgi:hypothetical protein